MKSLYCLLSLCLLTTLLLSSCNKEKESSSNKMVEEDCDKSITIDNTNSIEGYSDEDSYFPGDDLALKIHSTTELCDIEIMRHGNAIETIETIIGIPCGPQNYNCRSYSFGCDWETTYTYTLPNDLISGIYTAKLSNELAESFHITFVVKGIGTAPFLVLANTNTWQAYNAWGGHSFYQYDLSEEIDRSEIISFDRPNPIAEPFGDIGHLTGTEMHLYRWMESNGYDYHTVSDQDLHFGKIDLSNYETLVLNVHPEYWTREMRIALNEFISNGGNLINLGANGIYWKSLIVGKNIEKVNFGAHFQLDQSEFGGKWRELGAPESRILGVEYDTRGYDTYFPYITYKAEHWIFDGTGLANGDTFGSESLSGPGASGNETDKMTTDSPFNTVFLAKGANPDNGGATICYYEHLGGAKVFSTGSITFTGSLAIDPICHRITKNVFDAFN